MPVAARQISNDTLAGAKEPFMSWTCKMMAHISEHRHMAAFLLTSLASCLPGAALAQSAEARASAFGQEVNAFIGEFDVAPEAFEVRINRCDGPGPDVDDVYYVWVGARLVAPAENASSLLVALHAEWEAGDWDIYRYRHLDNEGVNLAARHPDTKHNYALDSGFEAGPQRYIVGTFSTPCFRDSDTDFAFGRVQNWSDP